MSSFKTKFTGGKDWWKDPIVILSFCVIIVAGTVIGTVAQSPTSMSGYQSITAEWYKVVWEYEDGSPYEKLFDGNIIVWDAGDAQPYGWNKNTYALEVEQPKYDRNINYHDWWINETVSESNPEGVAEHFEWAIDIYTVNVNFRATDGIAGADGAVFWLELQNNVNSVFTQLGAEAAASYVIYAQTEEYTKVPDNIPHGIILPTVSNFEMVFLDGTNAVPPGTPEEGSDLNFAQLEPYSHIAIKFIFSDFGLPFAGTEPTVNMVVELNVLTVGRFDYVLTYVEAGDNDIAPIGALGVLDGIGAALGAGFNALMDGVGGLGEAFTGPLVAIAVIAIVVFAVIILVRYVATSRVKGAIQ
jgi:hypothetical protein